MLLVPFKIKFGLTVLSNLYNFPVVFQAIFPLASPYIKLKPGAAIKETPFRNSSKFRECEIAYNPSRA